eukprot:tig00021037_g17468.t1
MGPRAAAGLRATAQFERPTPPSPPDAPPGAREERPGGDVDTPASQAAGPRVPPLNAGALAAAADAARSEAEEMQKDAGGKAAAAASERLSFRAGDANRRADFGSPECPRRISIIRRLDRRPMKFTDLVDQVLVLYCDFAGGMGLAGRLSPMALVALLDRVYAAIAGRLESLRLRKVELVSDALLLVSGLGAGAAAPIDPVAIGDAASRSPGRAGAALRAPVGPDGSEEPIQMRACVHAGSCIAARQVFGNTWLFYDLWGNVVFDVQKQCDSMCPPNRAMVTREAAPLLSPYFLLEGGGEGEPGVPTLILERSMRHPARENAGPPPSRSDPAAAGGLASSPASRPTSPGAEGGTESRGESLLHAARLVGQRRGTVGPAVPLVGAGARHASRDVGRRTSAILLPEPPPPRTTFTPVPPPPPPPPPHPRAPPPPPPCPAPAGLGPRPRARAEEGGLRIRSSVAPHGAGPGPRHVHGPRSVRMTGTVAPGGGGGAHAPAAPASAPGPFRRASMLS